MHLRYFYSPIVRDMLSLPTLAAALHVDPNTATLNDLKLAIQDLYGIPVSNQRITLPQSVVENDDSLPISDFGVEPSSTLTLHLPSDCVVRSPPAIVSDTIPFSRDSIGGGSSSNAKGRGKEPDEAKDLYKRDMLTYEFSDSDDEEYYRILHNDPFWIKLRNRSRNAQIKEEILANIKEVEEHEEHIKKMNTKKP